MLSARIFFHVHVRMCPFCFHAYIFSSFSSILSLCIHKLLDLYMDKYILHLFIHLF